MNKSRTLVVGDIHGALKALKQVLERAEITSNDRIIFLGDYVDGWSDSAQTLSFLIELQAKYDCVFIKGNHDDLVQDWLVTGNALPKWTEHGGDSTLKAYQNIDKTTKSIHIKFLDQLKDYYIDKQNRLFVHAGFTNLRGPENEFYTNMVFWDRTLWEVARSTPEDMDTSNMHFPDRLKLYDEIYIGHTPTVRIGEHEPVNFHNVWNLDTGVAFKGKLSLLDIETKEVWQSDPAYQLYPNENGRN
ncbi:MAG: metallophosphoesterase [Bacteroidota bacterium]